MIALTFVHLTDAARVAELVLILFVFLLLVLAAIGMWLEEYAPERDEDEELSQPPSYANVRRLPL